MNSVAIAAVLLSIGVLTGAADSGEVTLPANKEAPARSTRWKEFTLKNRHGLRAVLLEYGAILQSIEVPDRAGKLADITLGYDTPAGWRSSTSYFGAVVGRYANRIAKGSFTLGGKTYLLATNDNPAGIPCHLHGGRVGFDKRSWSGREVECRGAHGVEFTYVSPAGEEGYPGKLESQVTYWLTDEDELKVEFVATTDQPTIVNLTQHTYWNLTGDPRKRITGHELTLAADEMLAVNSGLIPTGERVPVRGTPFDFTQAARIGKRIGVDDPQLKFGHGYDHCWVLRQSAGVRLAARLYDPDSGRVLEVSTDQPGIQFYSGNFLDGTAKGKGGIDYAFRTGLCLETQKFPDSPNHPDFPSTELRWGEVYRHTVVYKFSTK
ncbi:MAG: aldose 1-epimerase [Verrucomicrobia bacterium]|nr:aldose 1-epimerase [Verrucomicrobiota bacterium]